MKKVLIANRGEIAVRIIRACKELGIQTVAVYSEADREALHVELADEAYCIGPRASKDSYLNFSNIISVATLTDCDGIHPGYGFLAENASFAELCEECNIEFIGPTSDAISRMGTKDVARETMRKAGVPIVPGSTGIVENGDEALAIAEEIGFPVIIKATAGGGGKGIRVALDKDELINGIKITQKEAEAAFGNPGVYIEKYIEVFRHVEVQVLADKFGNTIHLGERDCSIQRRMQKLVEEGPSPALTPELRSEMGEAAVKAAEAVNYRGAGTVEFIFDHINQKFYFMEMNTRIQVEHPVTEMITGIDLIQQQLKIASGEKLAYKQEDVKFNGWSIECRINAENPRRISCRHLVKLQCTCHQVDLEYVSILRCIQATTIPPFYDSMVAKLIVHADTREEAVARMKRALDEFIIEGVETTIPFHANLMDNEVFKSGDFDTKFLEKYSIMDEQGGE